MIHFDKQDSNGLWLKSYTVAGVNRKTRAGRLWNNLITRTTGRHKDSCYDEAINGFKDFQEFASWCQTAHGYMSTEDNGYYWQLDKDTLSDGKVYSVETCAFIPNRVNSMLLARTKQDPTMPRGVRQELDNSIKYVAQGVSFEGEKMHLGSFDTPEQAHTVWFAHKQGVVSMILKEYKLGENVVKALKARWNI